MKINASSPGSALMSGKTFSATSYSSWPASGFIPSIFATLVLPAIGVGAPVGPHGARRAPTAYEEDRILHPGWAGGNALAPAGLGDFAGQEERARHVADAAVALLDADRRLLMVHGNGPQVGALAMAQEAVAREMPMQPLFVLGAMTQGQLGYLLSQAIGDALASAGRPRAVAAVMTQVVVRRDDPAFATPTKPIGPFFSEGRARRLASARGWDVAEDAGRGWRRVVASPEPVEVVESSEI